VMLVVEGRKGLPLGVSVFPGNVEEKAAVVPTLSEGLRGVRKPRNLIGDANFSSQPLCQKLWKRWRIFFTAPPKKHYVHPFHDNRRLRRIKRRWKVERCFSWLKHRRKIELRWEVKVEHFLGLIQLCCCMILLKHLF
jgi:hypothetical protein